MGHGTESDEENGHEREQEGSNSEDGHVLESEQEEQSRPVVARTNEVRRNVKKALKSLQMTQKALSSKLQFWHFAGEDIAVVEQARGFRAGSSP